MTKVSVVIPTLGQRPEWLRTSIASVLDQEGCDVSLILSTPSTADVAELVQEFDLIQHVDDVRGLSGAVNSAVSAHASSADFVTWIGDDDVLAPGAFRESLAFFRSGRSTVATYGDVRVIDQDDSTVGYIKPNRALFAWSLYGRNHVPQPGSLYRREAWVKVGGLDPSLPHAMDLDLFWKMRAVGKVARVSSEVAAYRWHSGSISSNKGKSKDNEIIARKYGRFAPYVRRALSGTGLEKWTDRIMSRLSGAHLNPSPPESVRDVPYWVTPR